MEFIVRPHGGGQIYRFREETHFRVPVQTNCAFLSGGLTFRLPRVQDTTNLYQDITEQDTSAIMWYSRTGTQAEQADAVLEVVIPDLLHHNIRSATIILALEEQHLKDLDWEDTFSLLINTLERVEALNTNEKTTFDLVAAQMLLPIGEGYKPLQAAVVANNAAIAAFNFHIRGARTLELWRFAINRKARPDSLLKIAVEGMTHISLAPINYEAARIPSAACMLRMRKSIRTYLRVGVRNETQLRAPYRIKGTDSIVFPAPVATDKEGVQIAPTAAVHLRVQERLQGVLVEDMSPIPRILKADFTFLALEDAQSKVNRRREALRTSRQRSASRNKSPVAGRSTSRSRETSIKPGPRARSSSRSASCRPSRTSSSRRSRTHSRRSPSPRREKRVTFAVSYKNPAETRMKELRLQSEMERVRALRQEVEDKKRRETQQIKLLRKQVLEAEFEKALQPTTATAPRSSSSSGRSSAQTSKQEDARAKVKKLLDLAEVLKKQREQRQVEEEKCRIKAEIRRRAEVRRQEIEDEAKKSRQAEAIRRTIKVLHDTWSTDPQVRECRRDIIVRLGVESTDPEDRDQTVEYIRLSKVTKILDRNPGDLSGLTTVQVSSDSSLSSDSSSSSSSSDQGRGKKGEKRKRTARKLREEKKKKKD